MPPSLETLVQIRRAKIPDIREEEKKRKNKATKKGGIHKLKKKELPKKTQEEGGTKNLGLADGSGTDGKWKGKE